MDMQGRGSNFIKYTRISLKLVRFCGIKLYIYIVVYICCMLAHAHAEGGTVWNKVILADTWCQKWLLINHG